MKKLLLFVPAFLIFNLMPAFAQDTSVIQDFNLNELGIRLTINVVAVFILVRLIYFSRHKNKDFQFTLILFNCVNFLICYLLSGANLEVGFAFGLFAIFSIMRYRTVTVPVKEMGYLFICVALGLINSLATIQDNYVLLIAANAFIILLPMLLDRGISETITKPSKNKSADVPASTTVPEGALVQDIIYERIDLIKPESRYEMIEDLRDRTGLPVYKVDVVSIDLMQDVAVVKAYYNKDVNAATEIPFYSTATANKNVISLNSNHV